MLRSTVVANPARVRLQYLLAVAIYIAAIRLSYEWLVAPTFEAWGFGLNEVQMYYRWIAYAFAFAPALIISLTIGRPSELICHLQYLVIYIPCCLILNDSIRPFHAPLDLVMLEFSMFIGMLILIAMSLLPVRGTPIAKIADKSFWATHYLVTLSLIGYLLLVFGGYYVFAGFEDVYSVRMDAGDIIQITGQGFVNYAILWLATFFLPLIGARALVLNRTIGFAVCLAGYVYLFGISGGKAFLIAPLVLLAIWRLVRVPARTRTTFLVVGCTLLILVPFAVPEVDDSLESFTLWYKATVNARIFSIPQLALGQYFQFFQTHPTTYLSHVRIIDLLIANPYAESIPHMIGYHYYGEPVGLNLGTWGQDGIAGFGVWGIPFVSLLCGAFFWVMDVASNDLDFRFVLVGIGYMAICFTNLSLFTTMLSGGGLLLLLAFYVLPRTGKPVLARKSEIGINSARETI